MFLVFCTFMDLSDLRFARTNARRLQFLGWKFLVEVRPWSCSSSPQQLPCRCHYFWSPAFSFRFVGIVGTIICASCFGTQFLYYVGNLVKVVMFFSAWPRLKDYMVVHTSSGCIFAQRSAPRLLPHAPALRNFLANRLPAPRHPPSSDVPL